MLPKELADLAAGHAGQKLADEGLCYVEEELEVYVEGESLAYKVVNVFPQKLHHDDEEADAECACKQRQVVAQYEKVESLDEFQTVWKC